MTVSDLLNFYSPRLSSTDDLVLILDHKGDVLFANEAVRKIQSAPSGSYAPRDIIEQLQDEVRTREFSSLPGNAPPLREARLRVILPDGAGTRHVSWKFVGIPATDGAITLAWGTFRATGPGREMGFTVLPNGIIQAASPALCAVCGYSRDELVGRPARQFYYTAASRKRIVNQLNERNEVENGAVTLRCKDGSPLTLWYSAESIRGTDGRILAYSGFFSNDPSPFPQSWPVNSRASSTPCPTWPGSADGTCGSSRPIRPTSRPTDVNAPRSSGGANTISWTPSRPAFP